jgi:hypothetical protein
MQYVELRSALMSGGGTVTISSDSLTSNLGTLLATVYGGQPIVIGSVSLGPGDGENSTVVLTGTASLLRVANAPVELRAWVDASGNAQLLLRYRLRGSNPTVTDWRFSQSFPDLPKAINGSLPDEAPATCPLDELDLYDSAFVVSSSARRDPVTGVDLELGLNFVSQLRPTGTLAIIESVLTGSPTMTLYGTIRLPRATDITPALGASELAWNAVSVPGIRLRADLGASAQVGGLSLSSVNLRLYFPTEQAWLAKNSTYQPLLGFSGTLRIPSANLSVDVTMFRASGSGPLIVASMLSGVSLGSLSVLSDLAGTDKLLEQLPSQLQTVTDVLANLRLTEVALSIVPGSTGIPATIDWVSLTVALPNPTWRVFDGFEVSNLACSFEVVNPFASPSVNVTVTGTMQILGVAVAVRASSSNGFVLLVSLPSAQTVPLRKLVETYAPQLPLPTDLTIDTLGVAIAPATSYRFNLGLAPAAQPWTLDVGFQKLTISNVLLCFEYPKGGPLSGFYAGTISFGNTASLDIHYAIPGNLVIQGMFAEVSLQTLLSTLSNSSLSLPDGFDLTLKNSSVIIQQSGSELVFQLGTRLDSFGALAFQAARTGSSWGFATGLSLSSKASLLPGLGALSIFEDMFHLSKLLLVVSTFSDPSFAFLDAASFQDPALNPYSFALPTGGGLVSGLNLYGEWQIDTQDARQSLLKNLLGLNATLSCVLQFGQNPAQQARLQVGYSTNILGHPLVCTFGAELANGQPQLFLSGRMDFSIQGTAQQFSVRMSFVPSGAQLSATMQSGQPISCGPFQLANLALQVGVNWAGIPSLGIAATIATQAFTSSVALFFDSTNPARSMIAGSVSNLTLRSVLSVLTGNLLPSSVDSILDQIALSGTQEFDLPLSLVGPLTEADLGAISQAFAAAGVTIPSSRQQVLLIESPYRDKWFLTNLADRARQYQIERRATKLVGSVQAQFYFAPERTTIGALPPFEQGFFLTAKLSVFGFSAQGTVDISANSGIYVSARMDRVVIGSERLFSISSVDGTSGPQLSMATFSRPSDPVPEFRSPHVYVNGQVGLLGLQKHVYVRLSREMGFELDLGGDLAPGVRFELRAQFQSPTNVSANGTYSASVGTISLGRLGSVALNTGVFGTLSLGFFGDVATVMLVAGFQFAGQSFAIPPFTLDVQTQDLRSLAELLADKAKAALTDLMSDAARWVKYVFDQLISGVTSVGGVLKDIYGKTAEQAAALMKGAGYAASEVGNALKNAYSVTAEQAVTILKGAGYAASEVGNALKNAYSVTVEQAVTILKGAGYAASEVGSVLKDLYGQTADQVVDILRNAGYGVAAIGSFIQSAYSKTADEVVGMLQQVGVFGTDIVDWLSSTTSLQPSDLAATLKRAGYGVHEISDALQSGVSAVEGAIGTALRQAGFDAAHVMHALPSVSQAMHQIASLEIWARGPLTTEATGLATRISSTTQSVANTAAAGLQTAGYDLAATGRAVATEIGSNYVLPAISVVYRASEVAEYAKNVLRVPADQLASVFRTGLHLSGEQVQTILQGAGYSAEEVSNAMRSAYDWVGSHLDPSKW